MNLVLGTPCRSPVQAYNAATAAIADGHKLLEVEFPPLTASEMVNQASSANSISAANTELAIDLAEYFVREGKNVAIMVPDYEELENIEDGLGTLTPAENITIRSVRMRASESAETMADLVFGIFSRTRSVGQSGGGGDAGRQRPREGGDLQGLGTDMCLSCVA